MTVPTPSPVPPSSGNSPPFFRRSREHPIEVASRIELVKVAYAELLSSTLASFATVSVFTAIMAPSHGSPWLWSWSALMVLVLAVRVWLALAFKRAVPTPDACPRWALRMIVATAISGLGWGSTAWLLPTLTEGGPLSVAHVLVLAGMTIGAARLLLPMKKGGVAYLVAVMVPVALRYFAEADLVGAALGGCTVVFILFMAHGMLRNHHTFSEAIVMRFEREAIAEELTSEIQRRKMREAELHDARERAETASRAKGEFLATITHEIRTPMNGVLGMLRVLRDTSLTPDQQGFVRTASDSAESLLLLLSDVLDFSKIEAGRLEFERAAFDPARSFTVTAELLRARAQDKGLGLEVEISELPPAILGDAARVRQVLINLIGNAIKFTERGHVRLSVRCTERTGRHATLVFSVSDTGIGIDPTAMDRLFKPFSQVDASMSRKFGGTGLGLAISKRLAEAMGGSIHVESTPGKGSTFTVVLPCELPEHTRADASARDVAYVAPSLRGRVLVVEDDLVNQQVAELFLKKLNLAPSFAADGETAIAKASSEPFDVVLMDCQLPGIDGLEATRRIRQRTNHQALRIIALTANANTHVRDACLAAGMDDFVSKPIRFELLAEVLQRNLPTPAR